MLAEEKGRALLKEFVDVAFVRPKPPVDEEKDVSFEVNDIVDAFFQDGWWTGVVTEVVERNSRYKVFFSNPPEELEFGSSDLRVHKNWVDGKWVRPEKERMRELNFSPGAAVEVNIDPDNSPDVWFPAKFIKQVNNSFLVEYQGSQEAGYTQKAVDSLHIRPSPPPSSKKSFSLLEKVDAFYDFRWLSGVVTKILADGRYIVYFKRTKKEKELSHADLRLHMEWTDGKWVHSSQDTLITSIPEKRLECAVNGDYKEKCCVPAQRANAKEDVREEINSAAILKSCQNAQQTPGSGRTDNYSTMSGSRRIKTIDDVSSIYLKSSKRLKEKTASDAPLSPGTCKLRLKQAEGLHNAKSADLDSARPANPGKSGSKQSEDRSQSSAATENMENDEKNPVRRKRGRPPKLPESEPDTVDQTPNGRSVLSTHGRPLKLKVSEPGTVDHTSNESCVLSPHGGAIVIGLTHNGKMIESISGGSGQHKKGESSKAMKDEVKHSNTEVHHESTGDEQQKDGEVTNLKRKRGRPPKVLFRVGSPKFKEAELVVVESKGSVLDMEDIAETVNGVEPVASAKSAGIVDSNPFRVTSRRRRQKRINDHLRSFHLMNGGRTIGRQAKRGPKSTMEMVNAETTEPVKLVSSRSARRQRSTKQVEPHTEDGGDNLGERAAKALNNGIARDADIVTGTSGNVSDDDRPLSAWFEGAHSPPTTDGRAPVAGTAGQCNETGERRDGNEMRNSGQPKDKSQEKQDESTVAGNVRQDKDTPEIQDQMPVQSTAIVPVDNRELPFVKNSLIWQMIESMEVLKQIPQKPHFRPLYNCKEECREGLAIGNMVTFTSLVDRISRLQFGDPKSLLDGYLEALVDLEELGFNVAPIRDRLNALLSIKGRSEEAQNTATEIETQIVEHDYEKSEIEEEIAQIDKKMAELNEKRAVALSKKEQKDAEMKLLQSSVDAVKDTLESAREEFERLASSVW